MTCDNNIAPLIDRWISDPAFRAAMHADPDGTARAAGVSMSVDEQAAVRSIDWGQSDDWLIERISKGTCM